MKTEKQLYNYMKKQAVGAHMLCFKLHCESANGWPDVCLIYRGHTVLIELKSPSNKGRLSEAQKIMLYRLNNQGQETYVINTREEADLIIAGLINREPKPSYRPLV